MSEEWKQKIDSIVYTCPAIVQLLNRDKTLPPVTLDMVKSWKNGRYNPPPERAKQIEVIAENRKQLERWFEAQK